MEADAVPGTGSAIKYNICGTTLPYWVGARPGKRLPVLNLKYSSSSVDQVLLLLTAITTKIPTPSRSSSPYPSKRSDQQDHS